MHPVSPIFKNKCKNLPSVQSGKFLMKPDNLTCHKEALTLKLASLNSANYSNDEGASEEENYSGRTVSTNLSSVATIQLS